VVLHARIADRGGFHESRDLTGRREGADSNCAHRDLAVADDGGGKHRFALGAHYRQAFARDGLLIDHRMTVDDLAVDRNDLARIDHYLVAGDKFAGRHRRDDVVANDPGGLGLKLEQLTDRATRPGRRQIADPIAELDQPGHDRASHRIALQERCGDRQRVEEVDIEPALTPPYPPGAQGDRIGVPQHQRHVDGGHHRIGAERHHQRKGREPERVAAPDRAARGRAWDRSGAGRHSSAFLGGDQELKLVETDQREAAKRGAQNAFEAWVVFDD
jgi:hypothetical protein